MQKTVKTVSTLSKLGFKSGSYDNILMVFSTIFFPISHGQTYFRPMWRKIVDDTQIMAVIMTHNLQTHMPHPFIRSKIFENQNKNCLLQLRQKLPRLGSLHISPGCGSLIFDSKLIARYLSQCNRVNTPAYRGWSIQK